VRERASGGVEKEWEREEREKKGERWRGGREKDPSREQGGEQVVKEGRL
jgi:hypothetical protein